VNPWEMRMPTGSPAYTADEVLPEMERLDD
jgi:hypothetical protein